MSIYSKRRPTECYFWLYRVALLCCLITWIGCAINLNFIKRENCTSSLPEKAKEHFLRRLSYLIDSDQMLARSCIIDGRHSDLTVDKKGYLKSSIYGWKAYIRYEYPVLVYENNNYYLINNVSYVDWTHHPFRSAREYWMVVSKKTGHIRKTLEISGRASDHVVVDDVLYLKVYVKEGSYDYHCMQVDDGHLSEQSQLNPSLMIRNADIDKIQLYIQDGGNVNAKIFDGNTLLHEAVIYNRLSIVKLLLKHGAEVSAINATGYKPLFYAVESNNLKLVKLLFEHGADPNSKTCYLDDVVSQLVSEPLYQYSLSHKHIHIFEEFLKAGADISDSCQLLHIAAHRGFKRVIERLIDIGVDVNCMDHCGLTALQKACSTNNLSAARFLIRSGANVNHRDNNGRTALHHCKSIGSQQIVSMLLFQGADPTITDNSGKKPAFVTN